MSEARNNIRVKELIASAKAYKLTAEAIITRFGKTGNHAGLDGIRRHCEELASPSEERIAAADYARYVEAD